MCLLLAGTALALATPESTVTFENQDHETYYVMVYTVLDEDAAGYVNFEVTTDDSDRKLVTYKNLIFIELVRRGYPVLGTVATIQEAE